MFGVVREFQAPLGVTHALRGRFIPSSNALGIIFARKNSLDFNVVRANLDVARLELLQSTPLGANIVSMDVLRRANTGVDLLCLGFDRMRIAIMAWDHDARNWTTEQTIDLGSLLGHKLCSPSSIMRSQDPSDYGRPLLRGSVGDYGEPLIRTHPSGRCFAVLGKEQNTMYIAPVRSEDDYNRSDSRIVNRDDIFVIDLPTDYEASNVKDFAFLQGSFEPNILVLHEPKRTWSGRAAIQRNTCCLLNLSIDNRSRRHSKTWTMDQLPYDSQRVVAVPESAGSGALLMSTSVIMQVRHGACVAGLSLNCFGDSYSSEMKARYDSISESDTLVECDAAHCRFLDFEERMPDSAAGTQSIALLSLKGGELYFLNVAVGSRNSLIMKRAGSTVIASEIVPVNDRFFVLASRLSDSLLVEYQKSLETSGSALPSENANPNDESKDNPPTVKPKANKRKKRKRTAEEEAEYENLYGHKPPEESSDEESVDESGKPYSALELEEKDEGTRGVYDDEDELGWVFNSGAEADSGSGKGSGEGNWALKVKDTITCFGPGADLAIGTAPDDVTSTKLDMVVAGGYAKNGCLAVIHQSIRPTIRTEFEVPNCEGIWTLLDPSVAKRERQERDLRNSAAEQRNTARRARNTKVLAARKRFVEEEIKKFRENHKQYTATKDSSREDGKDSSDAAPSAAAAAEEKNSSNPNTASLVDSNDTTASDYPADPAEPIKPQEDDGSSGDDRPAKKVKLANKQSDQDTPNGVALADEAVNVPDEVRSQLEQEAEEKFETEEEEALEENVSEDNSLHAYMLLSTKTTTTALRTGTEIEELMGDTRGFTTYERTLAAGNVFGSHAIVQVTPSMVKVLKNGQVQCSYNVPDEDDVIKSAQVSDPLILLMMKDDSVRVLVVRAEEYEEESGSTSEENGTATVQEDLFDEYGLAVAGNESLAERRDAPDENAGPGQSGNVPLQESGTTKKLTSFRNFKLEVEFSNSEDNAAQGVVSAAYLYKGPLAVELAQDGILTAQSRNTCDEVSGEDRGPEQPNALTALPREINEEGDRSAEGNGQLEDDDRMLYGDGHEDEDDMMLYGAGDAESTDKLTVPTSTHETDADHKEKHDFTTNGGKQIAASAQAVSLASEKGVIAMSSPSQAGELEGQLLLMCKSTGALQIVSPSLGWQIVLDCPTFFAAPMLVTDAPMREEDKQSGNFPFAAPDLRVTNVAMMELAGSALLAGLSTPLLVAVSETGIPFIYRAFLSRKLHGVHKKRSRLSLHRIVSRDRTAALLARSMTSSRSNAEHPLGSKNGFRETQNSIVHFRNVAGRSGVFLGGPCPTFIFAERGYPRMHPLSHTSSTGEAVSKEEYDLGFGVVAFTEFHNVKCPRGFVSVGSEGVVRIGELPPPSAMNYDAPTPMKKIALRCTPHKVAYHAGSATYGVLASMPTLTTREERLARILQSLEKHDKRHYQHTAAQAEAETGDERANRVPPLFEELHELRVYRPDTWELIKSHKLQKGEVGLAIANMKVDVYKQKTAGSGAEIPSSKKGDDGNESTFAASSKLRPKDMLVIGTGYLNGEDASSRGRLLMFEVSRQAVYTEDGGVYTAFQLQLIAEKELFSPVTAVASMEGYVIAGVGPQVSVYKLVGDEIIHLSFAFGQLFCTSLASLKQYVVAADMCKSVSFMYFRDRNNSVNFLGKDYEHVTSFATEFLIENENVSIIVSDGKGNLHLMNYAHASVAESRGGKRLLMNGGICFGSRINKLVRIRSPDSKADLENGRANAKAGFHSLLFTTLDGGVGALVSTTEVQYRKIRELYDVVVEYPGIERRAGVNPIEQTAFRPETASNMLLEQRMVDSRALFDIFSVTLVEMRMIARKAGTDLEGLAKMIMDLDTILYWF